MTVLSSTRPNIFNLIVGIEIALSLNQFLPLPVEISLLDRSKAKGPNHALRLPQQPA
jgi:hypothetical protein